MILDGRHYDERLPGVQAWLLSRQRLGLPVPPATLGAIPRGFDGRPVLEWIDDSADQSRT